MGTALQLPHCIAVEKGESPPRTALEWASHPFSFPSLAAKPFPLRKGYLQQKFCLRIRMTKKKLFALFWAACNDNAGTGKAVFSNEYRNDWV